MVPATFGDGLHCDLCGSDLPRIKSGPRKGLVASGRRWCSTDCSSTYWANHQWNLTRHAALKRDDYCCVKCGSDGGTRRGICAIDGQPWPCKKAGQKQRESYGGMHWTVTHHERVMVGKLEVNHIEPRKGEGYQNGCWHHLDGVETLCRPCHVEVTQEQLRQWRPPKEHPPKGASSHDRPPEAPSLPMFDESVA